MLLMRGMGYGIGWDRGDYVPHDFGSSFRFLFTFPPAINLMLDAL